MGSGTSREIAKVLPEKWSSGGTQAKKQAAAQDAAIAEKKAVEEQEAINEKIRTKGRSSTFGRRALAAQGVSPSEARTGLSALVGF